MSMIKIKTIASRDEPQIASKNKVNNETCNSDNESSNLKTTLHDSLSYGEDEYDEDNDVGGCCSVCHHDDSEQPYHDNLQVEFSVEESNRHKRDVRSFNKSFSEKKIREIERSNTLLMNKILLNNVRKSRYPLVDTSPVIKDTSNSVNRKRRQQEIDRNNLLLLQRIQTVKPFGMSRRRN